MASFMRMSQMLVFHQSKCISAIKRLLSTTAMYVSSSSFMYLRIPCYSGPSPGFSSRWGQKPYGGAKNQRGGHIFKIQYWMYATTGGPNVKWGSPISNVGARHHWPPHWRRPWCYCDPCLSSNALHVGVKTLLNTIQ